MAFTPLQLNKGLTPGFKPYVPSSKTKVQQYQEEDKKLAEESKKANSFLGILKNTLKDLGGKAKTVGGEIKDVAKEFPSALGKVATEPFKHPIKTIQSVTAGAANIGPSIVNLGNKILGVPYRLPKLGLPTEDTPESDVQQAINMGTEMYSGYALGGAATKPLGLNPTLNTVVGNVAGGQIIADPDATKEERLKAAAFDTAFALGTQSAGALFNKLKPKPTPPLKVPVKSESVETKIPIKITPKTAPKTTIKPKVDKPLEPLAQEARKYKSAEEFVKAQGEPLYHGTTKQSASAIEKEGFKKPSELPNVETPTIKNTAKLGDHVFFTVNKAHADTFANVVAKDGQVLDVYAKDLKLARIEEAKGNDLMEKLADLKARGFDGSITGSKGSRMEEIAVWNLDKIKTKSQLTDFYNKAIEKPITVTSKPIEATSTTKVSKVGKSIEAKTVEKGLSEGFGETAGYDPITIKDQAQRVSKVMEDMDKATQMVKGEIPMESGLKGEMLIKAMEDHAQATGNVKLSMDIANSPLVSETSAHAQAMRILAERNPDSVVAKLREIKQAREARVEAKGKKISQAKKDTVKEIKSRIPKIQKQTWSQFIEEIKC